MVGRRLPMSATAAGMAQDLYQRRLVGGGERSPPVSSLPNAGLFLKRLDQ
jgi:hypothetical protein